MIIARCRSDTYNRATNCSRESRRKRLGRNGSVKKFSTGDRETAAETSVFRSVIKAVIVNSKKEHYSEKVETLVLLIAILK